jgi:hypothetical protein
MHRTLTPAKKVRLLQGLFKHTTFSIMKKNIISIEKKFAYRHKPTGKWVVFEFFIFGDPYLCLITDFVPEIAYSARNVIEEDFNRSTLHTELISKKNKDEFELVEIEIQHTIK